MATVKKLQKHLSAIFELLCERISNNDVQTTLQILNEEVKNLAARLGKVTGLDKKVERQIKTDLLQKFNDRAQLLITEVTEEEVPDQTKLKKALCAAI